LKRFAAAGVLCSLLLPGSVVHAQTTAETAQGKPDLSTPEATVRSFIGALNTYDAKRAEDCVFEANRRIRAPLLKQVEWYKNSKYQLTITDINFELMYQRYAYALINYRSQWVEPRDGKNVSFNATDLLKLVNMGPPEAQKWMLLSIDPQHHWSPAQGGGLQMVITTIAHPEVEGPEYKCRQHIQAVSGVLFYTASDHKGKMAVRENGLASPAAPEGKTWSLFKRAAATYEDPKNNYFPLREFHCPLDGEDAETESYSFNEKLDGVKLLKDTLDGLDLSQFTEPANTVLVYEGKDGKLNFRHDSRAFVVFADSHIELINEEQVKTLRWTP